MLQGLNNSLPLNNVNASAQPAQPAAVAFRGEEGLDEFAMQNPPEKKKSNLLKWLAIGTVTAGLILFRKKLPVIGKYFKGKEDELAKAGEKTGDALAGAANDLAKKESKGLELANEIADKNGTPRPDEIFIPKAEAK